MFLWSPSEITDRLNLQLFMSIGCINSIKSNSNLYGDTRRLFIFGKSKVGVRTELVKLLRLDLTNSVIFPCERCLSNLFGWPKPNHTKQPKLLSANTNSLASLLWWLFPSGIVQGWRLFIVSNILQQHTVTEVWVNWTSKISSYFVLLESRLAVISFQIRVILEKLHGNQNWRGEDLGTITS